MALHNRMREKRGERQLTQQELASMVGVTRQTIIAIERGGYAPSVALAMKLANALEIPIQELFWIDEEER